MAVKTSLRNIRLGAPKSVEITANQYPNAELTAQSMECCDTLTLHDNGSTKCVKKGAVEAAFRFVGSLARQRAMNTDDPDRRISFDAYAMSSACRSGGTVTLSATSVGEKVFWIIEGDTQSGWSITGEGELTIPSGCHDIVTIKAVSKTDIERRSMFKLDVEAFGTIYNQLYDYPDLCDILVEWTELAPFISKQSGMGKVISDYPNIVHSLLDTGKRNYVHFDGQSFINTRVIPNVNTKTEVVVKFEQRPAGLFGLWYGSQSAFTYMLGLFNGSLYMYGFGTSGYSQQGSIVYSSWVTLNYDITNLYVIGLENFLIESVTPITTSSNVPLSIGKANTSNGGQWQGTAECYIEKLDIYNGKTALRKYVPYKQDGVVGLMDLISLTFYPKDQGTGTLTIVEAEPRDN